MALWVRGPRHCAWTHWFEQIDLWISGAASFKGIFEALTFDIFGFVVFWDGMMLRNRPLPQPWNPPDSSSLQGPEKTGERIAILVLTMEKKSGNDARSGFLKTSENHGASLKWPLEMFQHLFLDRSQDLWSSMAFHSVEPGLCLPRHGQKEESSKRRCFHYDVQVADEPTNSSPLQEKANMSFKKLPEQNDSVVLSPYIYSYHIYIVIFVHDRYMTKFGPNKRNDFTPGNHKSRCFSEVITHSHLLG